MTPKEMKSTSALANIVCQLYVALARKAMELKMIPDTDDGVKAVNMAMSLSEEAIVKLEPEALHDYIKIFVALQQ